MNSCPHDVGHGRAIDMSTIDHSAEAPLCPATCGRMTATSAGWWCRHCHATKPYERRRCASRVDVCRCGRFLLGPFTAFAIEPGVGPHDRKDCP